MLSLSTGYLLGGKLSIRNPSLTKYGLIFFVASITVVPIVLFAEPIMTFIFTHIEDSRYGSLLASTALFFIPTTILGSSSKTVFIEVSDISKARVATRDGGADKLCLTQRAKHHHPRP